jgi:hypothetical protein
VAVILGRAKRDAAIPVPATAIATLLLGFLLGRRKIFDA